MSCNGHYKETDMEEREEGYYFVIFKTGYKTIAKLEATKVSKVKRWFFFGTTETAHIGAFAIVGEKINLPI